MRAAPQLAVLLASLLWTAAAAADGAWLWLVDADDPERTEHEQRLQDLLARDPGATHLVGRPAIARKLGTAPALPACTRGIGRCPNPEHMLLRLLGADLLVVVTFEDEGRTVVLLASDAELRTTRELRVEGTDLRGALLRAVAELTGATGRIDVTSTPAGATVLINGEAVGTAPWSGVLPVGNHLLALELAGHYPRERQIELRAGDALQHRVQLERRFATLVVRSATPEAEVLITHEDGASLLLQPGESAELDPGAWQVAVEAPGFTRRAQSINLIAGEDRELRMNLLVSPETLAARRRDRILERPLKLQATGTLSAMGDSGAGLSGDAFGGPQRVHCIRDGRGECDRRTVAGLGVDVDVLHTWNIFQLQVLGLGLAALPAEERQAELRGGRGTLLLDNGHRVDVRFLQPGVRYLFGPVVEPHARMGFAISHEAFRTEDPRGDGDGERFRRTLGHFQLMGGLRLHLNSLVYVTTDLLASVPMASDGPATRWSFSGGLGLNLPDVFGVNAALDRLAFPEAAPNARTVPADLGDTPEGP